MTQSQKELSAYLSNVLGTYVSLHQLKEIERIVNKDKEEMENKIAALEAQLDTDEPLFL